MPATIALNCTLSHVETSGETENLLQSIRRLSCRGWFDLPRAEITDEVKRDLRLLRLRGVMDPKRFYKNPDATKFPTHFAMGTVVEGPGEFNSGA